MIEERNLNAAETQKLLAAEEDHFFDFKSKDIQPSKLQETFVAFANADGGDIYIGVEDKKCKGERLQPFAAKEDANAILAGACPEFCVNGADIKYRRDDLRTRW